MPQLPDEDEMLSLRASALQMAPSAVLITDPDGVIEWVNSAFTNLTGYTVEEVIGQTACIFKSGLQDPSFYEDLWSTITSGKVWKGELINSRKDGSHYAEDMTIIPAMDDGGKIRHYVAFEQDISARRNVEEELRHTLKRQEERFEALERGRSEIRAVLDATSEAILLLSMDSRVIWANNAFERYFAVLEEELIGLYFDEMLPHFERVFENPSAVKARFEEALSNKDVDHRATVAQKWPRRRDIEIYSTLVKNELDESIGVLCVFRDVTREREVERMQSEFVSLVSHELRTPLTSIEGYVDMLLEGDAGDLDELQVDFLKVVKRNSERLTTLVSDLLDVSRIESGSLKLRWETVDVEDLIREVAANLMPQFASKKQSLALELGGVDSTVSGDPGRLSQALTNLLSNATKYTPEGGDIRVVTEREDTRLRIDIADTGIGLSEEDQKRLFTKFFRSEDPSIRAMGGTGLGLWLSKSIVEMHGGDISFKSTLGEGSTFTIRLPLEL